MGILANQVQYKSQLLMLGLANRTDGIIQGLIPNYFHYLILRAAYGIVRFMTHKHNKKVKGAKEVGIFIVL